MIHAATRALAAALLLISPHARAQPDEAQPDADAVVQAVDLAGWRSTPAGQRLGAALLDAGLLDDTARAWHELSGAIGLEGPDALDALLGRRAVLALDRTGDTWRWALVAEVTRATEDRVRRRLRPVPRAMLDGRAILSIERGAYELTTLPRLGPDDRRDLASLVLAPAGQRDWLEAMVRQGDHVHAAPPGIHAHIRPGAGLNWTGTARVTLEDDTLALTLTRDAPAPAAPTRLAPLDDSHALLRLATGPDWPLAPALAALARRIAPEPLHQAALDLTTGEMGLLAWPAAPGERTPALELAAALRVTDAPRATAVGDAYMEHLARWLHGSVPAPRFATGFSGAFPDALRSLRVPRQGSTPATLTWRTIEVDTEHWWIAAMGDTDAAAALRLETIERWVRRGGGRDAGWGHARLAELTRLLALDPQGPAALARGIPELSWRGSGPDLHLTARLDEPHPR